MIQQRKNLIILDFDGTILDSTGIWNSAYQIYCKENNLKISEMICQNKISFNKWVDSIKEIHKYTQSSTSLIIKLNKIANELYKKRNPKEGFADFILYRRSIVKSKIIIVSREEPDLIKTYFKHHLITGVSEVYQDKNQNRTDTNFYIYISNMYSCKIQDITLIDDSLSHCITAKKVGIFVIGMNDNHPIERQNEMRLICDMYVNDFIPLFNLWTN